MRLFSLFILFMAGASTGASPVLHQAQGDLTPIHEVEDLPERIACVTAPYLTTSFFIVNLGDKIRLTIRHHNGLKYIPVQNSLIAKSDLEPLKEKADLLSRLGREVVVTWDRKDCEWQGQGDLNCYRNKDERVGDVDVRSVSLTLLPQVLQNKYGSFSSIAADFSIGVKKDSYTRFYRMPMRYTSSDVREANECWAETQP